MLVVVQARYSSFRLPGKVLRPLAGRPLLGRTIDRLRNSDLVSSIVVATSQEPSDDIVAHFCSAEGVEVFRGLLDDVASRFRDLCVQKQVDAFVRISGDSPLIDPMLVDKAINLYRAGECDMVTNLERRTFPKGQSVEVIEAETFIKTYDKFATAEDFEHVTAYYYRNIENFAVVNFSRGEDSSRIQLSIDTEEDFHRISTMIKLNSDAPLDLESMLASYTNLFGSQ